MISDHERAKDAYLEVAKFITAKHNSNHLTPEIPKELAEKVYFGREEGNPEMFIYCIGGITEDQMKELKDLIRDNKDWSEIIKKLKDKADKIPIAKFRTWVSKFPSMVQTCGLLQTAAFYQEKEMNTFGIVEKWLKKQIPWGGIPAANNLLSRLSQIDSPNMGIYRLATREAIAYMTWVKRAATVLIPETAKGD